MCTYSEANEASEHDDHVAGEHGHAHRASDNAQAHDHAHSHDHGHAHESHGDDSHGHSYGEGGCGCGHSHGMDGSGTLWDDIVHEVTDMCPWLIIGLVVAVLLQVLPIIPSDLSVYLGGRTRAGSFGLLDAFFASVRGAVVGLCVPLCSCGVLPFAVLLAKQGCSPAVVTAFVTASQSAGLDSAVVTYGVLGPTATAARLVGALCLAIAGGIAATSFAGKPAKPASKDTVALAAKSKGACKAGEKDVQTKSEADEKAVHDHADGEGQGHAHGKEASKDTGSNWVGDDSVDECCDFDSEADTEPKSLFYRVFINPFKLLLSTFEEIVPWLGFGLVLSCVCTRYVREPAADAYLAITEHVGENSPVVQEAVAVLMRGAVLAATIPLQLCEHATVTFTRALKQAGASNGLAFGFLSLTPSVNVATLGVLLKGFPASTAETSGMRVVRVCVALVSTAVLLSLAVDHWDIEVMPEADAAEEHLPAWLVDGFLMAAGVLSVASVVRRMFF
ncbi:hypothetical protein SARC_03216 [Sphaeroforma arctica JP610]|uniref:Permease n=1 Tax=Sphaeroforma arctica JP610 TaxID=667725 RepID=A0A0L0G8M7_9EUKA|nr:hypothetical protein SARC_03216 [Sphaeroforma arctica JP610]KNC84573.1 hypothetical protein SARC_03216 [Sphaeroforma arctica JP610]|eukprot:XP_014158475.1 hypothetical protein SARC_03216 [Sphaeroforma arctica JP610]